MTNSLRNERGMTLFEIIVVLVIVTSVGAMLFKTVAGSMQKAKVNETRLRITEIEKAIEQYNADCGNYPQTLNDLLVAGGNCSNWGPSPYIKENGLLDAWKNKVQYTLEGSKVTITSLGADRAVGGEGVNADITNKEQ